MSWQHVSVVFVSALVILVGCQRTSELAPRTGNAPQAKHDATVSEPETVAAPNTALEPARPHATSATTPKLAEENLLGPAQAMHRRTELPSAKFRSGHVSTLEFQADRVTPRQDGFAISLPSESPIPTPTVFRERLYVSGGFSSEEYYCFDAQSGDLVWAKQLDDDGPSSAVPYDDSIIFSCESCTLFALNADTGEMKWSHWLGDPLLSMPTVARGYVFAAYPASADETTLPAVDDGAPAAGTDLRPTHIAACFDARTGEMVWRHWIDSDCMTAPVAADEKVFFNSLAGTVYEFQQADGKLLSALRLRATSAPAIAGDGLYLTRRADSEADADVFECITRRDLTTNTHQFLAARRPAPYLDQAVQREASYSAEADSFESPNGIGGGGFGGGFGGGGQFSIGEQTDQPDVPQEYEQTTDTAPSEQQPGDTQPHDALGVTELQAANNIGLGNVSTLQNFQGSRILYRDDRIYCCMGDRLICVGATSGEELWSQTVEGNLIESGGHLASPPIVAGGRLLVCTVTGKVLLLNPATGVIVQSHDLGSAIRFPPVASAGRIYVGTQDGKVICINTGDPTITGWPMWGGDATHRNVSLE